MSRGLSVRIEPKDPEALTHVPASTPPAQSLGVHQASVARRRSCALQEGMVALPEPVAILLNRRRRYGGIAEVWMLFHAWTQITRHITPRRFESIVESLTGDLAKFRRWRRSGIDRNRPRMRTPGHGKGQKQRTHHNPFLHVFVLAFQVSPSMQRESCMLSKPAAAVFVAHKSAFAFRISVRRTPDRPRRGRRTKAPGQRHLPSNCRSTRARRLPDLGALTQRKVNGDFITVEDGGARKGIGCGAGA